MNDYTTLLFDLRDGVARITLNRPEAANSLNEALARDFMHAMLRCDEDPAVRAVVLTGAGRMFCAGGDLKSFAAQGENLPAHLKEVTTYFHAGISRMARMDAPVVAAVNGAAAGAGMSLACACDLVVAGESARFTMAYTRAGLTPDGSSTYFLPRIVGLKRALELTLTNRLLSAREAQDWGIVARVVADTDLLDEAATMAAELAAGPTKALGMAKRLLHTGWNESLETQMEHESQGIAAMAHTADGREGIDAFLNKRAPAFRGA
jgi:2-(1,2-epoxy-1,2-dihydrophenyl)acetyl-CoA isomerase